MCGIAGFTRFHHITGDTNSLHAMGNAIFHRGPDAGNVYLDDFVGLCHRRLAIIDLSEAGNQPMHSGDGKLVIVFNGEIYNFLELRDELEKKGYVFKSKTDTEVILALYQFEGEKLVERINGMFAFALWDSEKKTLFIARDRLGKKPLYYYQKDDKFIFASEIKSILALEEIDKTLRDDAVYDFFSYQYVPDPKTIFKHIHKLEAANTLSISAAGIKTREYWQLSFLEQNLQPEETIAEQLRDVINDCVKRRMISDVPLGAFLSGGVDSSGVVAMMAQQSAAPVTTCSIGFDSDQFDEVKYAREIAKQFGTDHHEFTVKQNVEDNLDKIASYFDEPFADPSLVPTYFVSQLARKKVTVALAGDGGDENFAGYSKYATDAVENRLRNLVPPPIRKHVLPKLAQILEKFDNIYARKGHTLLYTLSKDPAYGFYLTNSFMSDQLWRRVVRNDYQQRLNGYHPFSVTLKHYQNAKAHDHLSRILYTDIKTYLVGDILVKVDRMSMANSLEVRAPLLDYTVVENAAKIPPQLKLNGSEKKYILKKAFSKFLSNETLYRKKMGFSVPLAEWLRHQLKTKAESLLFSSKHGLPDYFKMEEVKKIWNAHQAGSRDYSSELWSMVMFQLWFNRYAN